jgi:hypothetical protein
MIYSLGSTATIYLKDSCGSASDLTVDITLDTAMPFKFPTPVQSTVCFLPSIKVYRWSKY